jgi:dCMP deaminase
MHRPTLNEVYLRMLDIFARRSTCTRRQVAAIITDAGGKVLSCGYNGVPKGFVHCNEGGPCLGRNDPKGDTRRCDAVHAEQNALLQCGSRLAEAHTLYCSCTPCFECAKLICNTNIKRVVVTEHYADTRGKEILEAAHIRVEDEPADESVLDGTKPLDWA